MLYLADAIFAESSADRLYRDSLVETITLRILQRWSNISDLPQRNFRGGLAPGQLKRACEAMADGVGDDISFAELARIAGCSPSHLSRAFKQSTGKTPSRWLLDLRIHRARELLADQQLSLAQIALATGFSAQPQFTTAFGRMTGVTAGRYRRERRQ